MACPTSSQCRLCHRSAVYVIAATFVTMAALHHHFLCHHSTAREAITERCIHHAGDHVTRHPYVSAKPLNGNVASFCTVPSPKSYLRLGLVSHGFPASPRGLLVWSGGVSKRPKCTGWYRRRRGPTTGLWQSHRPLPLLKLF